jgi:hypothetical protein
VSDRRDRLWWDQEVLEPLSTWDARPRGGRVLRGVVHGTLPNKSNSRRIGWIWGRGGKKRVISQKSAEARGFERQFANLVRCARLPGPALVGLTTKRHDAEAAVVLRLDVVVYVSDLRRDLDVELLRDCLQKTGVVENDRGVWQQWSERRVDEENPRIEFALYAVPLQSKVGAV